MYWSFRQVNACQVIYASYQPEDSCPDQLLHSFMTEVSIIVTFLYDRDLRHERVKINCNLWSSSMGCNDAIFEWRLARSSVILSQLAFSRTPFDYGSSFADQISFDKDLDVQMVFWIFQWLSASVIVQMLRVFYFINHYLNQLSSNLSSHGYLEGWTDNWPFASFLEQTATLKELKG